MDKTWTGPLGERNPEVFIEVLRNCTALAKLLPELDALFGVPQPEAHHPEVDTGLHVLMALQQAASISDERDIRFAVLTHDLGKGTTPEDEWPRHIDHEQRGLDLLDAACQRLPALLAAISSWPARYASTIRWFTAPWN